ncbi:MAG: DUF1931 domain-containing protein [Planctomycetota bacterium]
MADKLTLLVGSKVKQVIKEKDMMCSAEVLDTLNDRVHELLNRAADRAKENGRKTVQARDV